ncbi:hypothetical protein MBLNU13_g07107t1 [Cladosporium sp. NU13]
MATDSVFSQTLQAITTAKLSELSNKRATFDTRHGATINSLHTESDLLIRVTTLLEGVKHCFNIDTTTNDHSNQRNQDQSQQLEIDLRRLERFLEQARVDPSLTGGILTKWEETLNRHLDVQSQRYQYATLYGQLVTEWLSPDKKQDATTAVPSADVEMGDGFEELPGKNRLEAREQFENTVFTSANVNGDAIKQYLTDVFSDEEGSEGRNTRKAITALRESTHNFEIQLARSDQFNIATVTRSIVGLLKGSLFAGEKRTVLKNFQNNEIILSEIADVLNMRMSALSTWSWGSGGVPVEQRRKLNGRFDIFMHQDLLQAIFLQFIGAEWSVFFKTALSRFRRQAWKSNFKQISRIERKRREYYLGTQETDQVLARLRRRTYRRGYFLYHLLDSLEQEFELGDGEEEADFGAEDEEVAVAAPLQAQMSSKAARYSRPMGLGVGGAKRHRRIAPVAPADDEESDDDTMQDHAPKKPMERKQDLLHLLTTEAAVNKRIHGSFTAFRSVFDELQNSLPHQTVSTVMEFFGVSKKWLSFFSAYLQAPLRFLDDENSGADLRTRKRGVPASHTLSDVFSEAILFCVDLSINRHTNGSFLYRLADDFWFWSHDYGKALTAWNQVQKFAKMMGLTSNEAKSGSISVGEEGMKPTAGNDALPSGRIRWGMMYFHPEVLRFNIDQKMVDEHIDELKKQLAAKESVFDWIQVWNAYANTFFTSNFGKAANCFGRDHIDEILATHQRIQKTVFDGKDVAQHLKAMIESRFGVKDLADAFLFFPVELGGLELKSPFVSPLQIRDNVAATPINILDEFEEREKEAYQELKADFDKGNDPEFRDDVDEPNWAPSEGADEFMSFEEYTRYREEFTTTDTENFLFVAYRKLMETPSERSISASPPVLQALEKLTSHAHARGITHHWSSMDAYWKWTAELYGPEMIERFGGLNVVESGLLPIGMVGLFRDQKVKWQG